MAKAKKAELIRLVGTIGGPTPKHRISRFGGHFLRQVPLAVRWKSKPDEEGNWEWVDHETEGDIWIQWETKTLRDRIELAEAWHDFTDKIIEVHVEKQTVERNGKTYDNFIVHVPDGHFPLSVIEAKNIGDPIDVTLIGEHNVN